MCVFQTELSPHTTHSHSLTFSRSLSVSLLIPRLSLSFSHFIIRANKKSMVYGTVAVAVVKKEFNYQAS